MEEVSVHVDASPDTVWTLVSDITRMGEWSPECFRCVWLGSARGPGAWFLGFNHDRWAYWPTVNRIEVADRAREFAFRSLPSGVVWRYRLEPEHGGTRLTEQRDTSRQYDLLVRAVAVVLGGKRRRDQVAELGMRTTLNRIKRAVELAPARA